MPALNAVAGPRSLRTIIATASSARVLDLHALAAEGADDPDYAEHPMFLHPVLNRSIIIKHNPRAGNSDRLPPGRFCATKVIFPFDPADLSLGGQWLFVGQRNFTAALARHLDYTHLSMDRDVAVLRVLDRLPTLDPFLIRESLQRQAIEVGRCYCRFSEMDRAQMLGFVSGEIEALIQLCFGAGEGNEDRTRRLSQLLLANRQSAELEPLRETFRMEPAAFFEAMFCWKAFLYYRWRSRALNNSIRSTLRAISAIRAGRSERDEPAFVMRAKQLVEKTVTQSWREVGQRLKLYDDAFASLTGQGDPDAFRTFLVHSPSLFIELGERIGRLEQTVGFWSDRFGDQRVAGNAPDGVAGAMRDLLQTLSLELTARPTMHPGSLPAAG